MQPEELKGVVMAILYAGDQIAAAVRSIPVKEGNGSPVPFKPPNTDDIAKRAGAILAAAQKEI